MRVDDKTQISILKRIISGISAKGIIVGIVSGVVIGVIVGITTGDLSIGISGSVFIAIFDALLLSILKRRNIMFSQRSPITPLTHPRA